MQLWKLELDEDYFRIYDPKKRVAGYFDPDYGDVFPRENREELVSAMLKNRDKVPGGAVMVPMVKFNLFDTDLNTSIYQVEQDVQRVGAHLKKWMGFLSDDQKGAHSVRISHTDQDMLTIAFRVTFASPTPLGKDDLRDALVPTLDRLQGAGLL